MMVPSNTRMHPWEHGQVSWELGVSDSDLEGFVCQLWLSRHTFKWFLKLLLTRALSMSTHVSLALPRKSESQAGLGPVTHLPESLKTLVTVTLSFRGQSGDSEQKWPVELPFTTKATALSAGFSITRFSHKQQTVVPTVGLWHQSAADLICTAVASPRCHGTDCSVLMDHSPRLQLSSETSLLVLIS